MADEIIEVLEGGGNDRLVVVPRAALHQHGFSGHGHEEGVEQFGVGLVEQQVLVMLTISWQQALEDQLKNLLGLARIAERCFRLSQRLQPSAQERMEYFPNLVVAFL